MQPINKGRVSIVVPVYNLDGYVSECLRSLCDQTYSDIEIVVVDDGSKDQSWNIIQNFARQDNRIKAIQQPNGGAARARNAGLEVVSGEFLMFVDGDDRLDADTISKNIGYFDNQELDWVEFPVRRVDKDGRLADSVHLGAQFDPKEVKAISASQFISGFMTGELSRLVCGAIYRYDSVKHLRFPDGEYYEDSFYFLDIITTTHQGIISPYGGYLYVDRDGSSQHIALSKARLCSKLNYDLKLLSVLKNETVDHGLIEKLYESLYYFYRLQKAKGIDGASDCFNRIVNIIGRHRLPISLALKIFLYEAVGYENIVRVYRGITNLR